MSLFIAIIALSFLIFFHELGHFLAARIFGVKVETFSIGFGPKLLSFYHKDIQYCLSAIPLGGYVKMKGEIQSESQGISQQPIMQKSRANDSLQDKHPYQRIIILLAGPFFNFLFAFLLYWLLVFNYGISMPSTKPIVGAVNPNFASYTILEPWDMIVSINGNEIKKFTDISNILNEISHDTMKNNEEIDSTKHHFIQDKTAKLIVLRPIHTQTYNKDSHANMDYTKAIKLELVVPLTFYGEKLVLGIVPLKEFQQISFSHSFYQAYQYTWNGITMIYDGLKKLIVGAIGLDNISSVIGITQISAKAYQTSMSHFIVIIALISINLGILNLLPLPLLDGGQIIFTLYEWIMRRRISHRVATMLTTFGISFIILLMLIGIFNDITRISQNIEY